MTTTDDDQRIAARESVLARTYPEVAAGGFSRVDGTVEFYTRVNALLRPHMTVVDYGAGRGAFVDDDANPLVHGLQTLRGKVREVVGLDIDDVVLSNPVVDRAEVIAPAGPLPLETGSVDLVLSDYTFEHVDHPAEVAGELARVLRPGGWVCARTPNRLGYIGLATNLIPNARHAGMLRTLQPGRQAQDVFPTRYHLNTRRSLRRYFPPELFDHYVYALSTEPLYFGNSPAVWRAMAAVNRHTPQVLGATLMIFLRKKETA